MGERMRAIGNTEIGKSIKRWTRVALTVGISGAIVYGLVENSVNSYPGEDTGPATPTPFVGPGCYDSAGTGVPADYVDNGGYALTIHEGCGAKHPYNCHCEFVNPAGSTVVTREIDYNRNGIAERGEMSIEVDGTPRPDLENKLPTPSPY
ncbi:MAG: hypothetical protein ACMG6E_01880 [Candidatus Roizmanbacteria bacterium]